MIIRLRGKLIEQSEAGKCLVIGTIMADRLIIKQQKISVICLVEIVTFLRYTPSKRSVLLWVEIFMTLSTIWQMY